MRADWNNYSESKSLKQAIEEYKETFGFYPKTILADQAYLGRENRLWCNSLEIRLSGPRLGRKSAEEKQAESKQIYQDGCDRVVIEGTFGVVKRRYSLERVMTRLPDTSMTSIAMGVFAANMKRKLRLLFAPECGWALDYDFDLGELVIFSRFPDVPTIRQALFAGLFCLYLIRGKMNWVMKNVGTWETGSRRIHRSTGTFTSGGKRPLSSSLRTPKKNTLCVIHNT